MNINIKHLCFIIRRKGIDGILWTLYFKIKKVMFKHTFFFNKYYYINANELISQSAFNDRLCLSAKEIIDIQENIPDRLKHKLITSIDKLLMSEQEFRSIDISFPNGINRFHEPDKMSGWSGDLDRHLFLVKLAQAFIYSDDIKYLNKLFDITTDWNNNPVSIKKANWDEPFEVAARLNNWILVYRLLSHFQKNREKELDIILKSILNHASWLSLMLEFHVPNNHLLLEAKVLYQASYFHPDVKVQNKWRIKARNILFRQIERQFFKDGGHNEQTLTYHRILTTELLELLTFAERVEDMGLASFLRSRIENMLFFLLNMVHSSGYFFITGDTTLSDTYYRFNPFMLAAVLFGGPEYKEAAEILGEDDLTYFVMGVSGSLKYRTDPTRNTAPTKSIAFPSSGYYIMRDQSLGLVSLIDCGQYCDMRAPFHGHDDILSFELIMKNTPIIVDSGNYDFRGKSAETRKWRRYFRGAKSHNTLILNGKDRTEILGNYDVSRMASPRLPKWHTDNNIAYFIGAHDGYCKPFGVIHQREIVLIKGQYFLIIDRLLGDKEHEIEVIFHVAPDKKASLSQKKTINIHSGDKSWARLDILGPSGRPEIVRGSICPIQGWAGWSSHILQEIDVVIYKDEISLPSSIITLIQPDGENPYRVEKLSVENSRKCQQVQRFQINNHDNSYEFCSSSSVLNYNVGYSEISRGFMVARHNSLGSTMLYVNNV